MALFDRPQCGFLLVFCCYCVSALTISISKIVPSVLLLLTMISLVSDIAIFVLKRDVKLQPTMISLCTRFKVPSFIHFQNVEFLRYSKILDESLKFFLFQMYLLPPLR